ncbi:hypothetical protein V7793_09260 [Streptomyces sp. KLMMK]|uniref:hypothetical protein n=1 Tax=Streptomyces sp. KLMMK TaxID=3109353 RepID=UPI00300A511F
MLGTDQRLAMTIGGLLLVGGVLISQALIGTWVTFSIGAATAVGAHLTPWAFRELTIRRFVRRLRRWPAPHRRS